MRTNDTLAPPGSGRARRLVHGLLEAVHDINAAQQAMFESYLRYDRYLLHRPDDDYLHWEPAMPGWRLSGTYLSPRADEAPPPCRA